MLPTLCCLLLSLAPLQEPAPGQAQGVTVPLDRALESKLADARELLASDQSESAIALLQEILEAGSSSLVTTDDYMLCQGASVVAANMLAELGEQAASQRNVLVQRYGFKQLAEALHPPDPVALQELLTQYSGTEVGDAAQNALQELAHDRGYSAPKRLDQWRTTLPFYSGLDDPALPLVEAKGLRPLWRYDFIDNLFDGPSRSHRMAFGEGLGFISNGVELTALNLGNGSIQWRFHGAPGWEIQDGDAKHELAQGYNPDTLTIPVLEDGIVLAVLQEPGGVGRFDEFTRGQSWKPIPVRRKLPARRLFAFDAQSGDLLWKQEVPWTNGNTGEPRGMVAAPPAVADGRVFLPVYDAVGTIDLSMVALDLYTGEQLWKTFVVSGQQETNLFGNILREMACQPPAANADRVLFCSNLGTISALEASSGRTLWTRLYDRADVDVYQNGMESIRQDTFANGTPAFDGRRFLCAPRDGVHALLINAKDGGLMAQWPFTSKNYGTLRSLIGATDKGAWFHGTRMAFLPFPGSTESAKVSQPLFSEGGIPGNRHAAALARGEILAPAIGAVEVLQASNLRRKSMLQNLGGRSVEMGPVQTAPGLAFIMRDGGISAFSSPDAILNSLLASNLDEKTLNRLLPYLEGIDLTDIPTARRLANRARDLAAKAPSKDLAERLKLIAARSLLTSGEGADALPLLNPIMQSSRKGRQYRAAVLALDILEVTNPAHPMMNRVLGILESNERSRITRTDGRRESKEIVLARARVLRGGQIGFSSDDHLESLLHLMTLPGIDEHRQGSLTLSQWGRLQLQNILLDNDAGKKLEAKARLAFQQLEVDNTLLLQFAGTQTAWNWLQKQADLATQSRALGLQVAGWLRNYDWPQQGDQKIELDTQMLIGDRGLGRLPTSLQVLRSFDLGQGAHLIDVAPIEGGARLLVKESASVRLVDLLQERRTQSPAIRLANDPRLMPDLRERAFAHDLGGTVVAGQTWVNLRMDGSHEMITLPGRTTKIHRIGQLLALLCAQDDEVVRLQVRDLISGTLLVDLPVPMREDRYHHIASQGETLLLLQQAKAQAIQVQMFSRRDATLLPLPAPPSNRQLDYTLALENGYLLPFSRRGSNEYFKLVQGDLSRSIRLPDRTNWSTFQAPTGIGWKLQSHGNSDNSYPNPTLIWKGSEMESEKATAGPQPIMLFPQLNNSVRTAAILKSNHLVSYSHSESGELTIQQWSLPADGPAKMDWNILIEDLPFDGLVSRLPIPVAANGGWLLPLKFMASRTNNARVVNLLISNQGEVLDRFALEAPTKYSHIVQPWVLDKHLVLRHESRILLLGDAK